MNTIKKIAISVLLLLTLNSAQVVEAATFNPNTGHWYELLTPGLSWDDAEAEAVLRGGHLVTINDANENQWILDNFDQSNKFLWIGFNDIASEGNFEWTSGEAVTYTNWRLGEPNNSGDEDRTWMYLTGFSATAPVGTWNDAPGTVHNAELEGAALALVEYTADPSAVVPLPAALPLLAGGLGLLGLIGRRRKRKTVSAANGFV